MTVESKPNLLPEDSPILEQVAGVQQALADVGSLLQEIKEAQDRAIRKEVRYIHAGNDVSLNFVCNSIYVDNANNANDVTFSYANGRLGFIIPANTAKWIHPLGASLFSTSGTGSFYAMFVRELITIGG